MPAMRVSPSSYKRGGGVHRGAPEWQGSRYLGAESASDEGEVPGQGQTDELKEVPMLAGLGTKSLARIVAALEPRSFQPGSTIVKQGEPGDSFYIVRSGSVQVMLEREGTPAITVAELGPREGFGEMALLTDQPRSASVVAVTDVETWCLSKVAFQELVSQNLSLALYFNRILSQRLSALQERILP